MTVIQKVIAGQEEVDVVSWRVTGTVFCSLAGRNSPCEVLLWSCCGSEVPGEVITEAQISIEVLLKAEVERLRHLDRAKVGLAVAPGN